MSWVLDAIGPQRVERAREEANRRRARAALQLEPDHHLDDRELAEVGAALELRVFDLLRGPNPDELRGAAADAFQVLRAVEEPGDPTDRAEWLLRTACIAVLGDRGADIRRLLVENDLPALRLQAKDWGERVWATTLDTWLRAVRKAGWDDLDRIQRNVVTLREAQHEYEPAFLEDLDPKEGGQAAWQLIAQYHLAKAAEVFAIFTGQGSGPDGGFDIQLQLEAQFDRSLAACARGGLIDLEVFVSLLGKAAAVMVTNSIWVVTRAVNSRVTKFVQGVVSRSQSRPIFEMLPPQRRTLREAGLLGSAHRSVVVSLPTSSGKTMIAQFRILQALNQFDAERGWVAYLAPTRALVKQLTVRLRRDFSKIGVGVEQVSPALEVDGLEAQVLTEQDRGAQFRVLVTTPEKLDLMIRGGWEEEIGRPLTLVVVDEAHNLQTDVRGLKLELLLATINRECKHAQFLLLTPFIDNAREVSSWLDSESHHEVAFSLEWAPNDRIVALAEPDPGPKRGDARIRLTARHTSKPTLSIPEELHLQTVRPLGLTASKLKAQGALAAATAQELRSRGTVLILADKPTNAWGIARKLATEENHRHQPHPELTLAKQFLAEEFGHDFELVELLDFGVGVHHAGLSDEAKALIEWLTESGHIDVLVATTTLAQGVNFPVSAVVLASHQFPYGVDMRPEEFWNIAGRAGRVDQGDLGIVALAAGTSEKAEILDDYLKMSVGALNSTLISMVKEAHKTGNLLALERLSYKPEWSSFLQYLVHTYRMLGDQEKFARQVEQVLRGTLGFQELRVTHPTLAKQLVAGVHKYGERLSGKPLKLVDSTGFSLESVVAALGRLRSAQIEPTVWNDRLFESGDSNLGKMMGVLLQVPELRSNLEEVLGRSSTDSTLLAQIVRDWVTGRSLPEMASAYFPADTTTLSMTKCCQSLFSRLTQTTAWGLGALQALTLGETLDQLPQEEQRSVRNLPARVYYGVNNDAALALRLSGVPRQAAEPMAKVLNVASSESISTIRARLRESDASVWTGVFGELGPVYRKVWSVVEGEPL